MTKAVLFALVLTACVDARAESPTSMEESIQIMKASASDGPVIASFSKHAAAGNIDALVSTLDPVARKQAGDAAVRTLIQTEVIPFFAGVKAVDTYETIARAALPDGRIGRIHYTYVETTAGKLKPIAIALVGDDGRLSVVYVNVGQCVPGRHPSSKGRCD